MFYIIYNSSSLGRESVTYYYYPGFILILCVGAGFVVESLFLVQMAVWNCLRKDVRERSWWPIFHVYHPVYKACVKDEKLDVNLDCYYFPPLCVCVCVYYIKESLNNLRPFNRIIQQMKNPNLFLLPL